MLFRSIIATSIIILSGCATSLGVYDQRPVSDKEAIVLVGLDSEIPLAEARYCKLVCTTWYQLGGRNEIMAYPVVIGSNFQINTVLTMDGRIGHIKGEDLKIEQNGIYYYGTIISSSTRVGVSKKQYPRMLLAARRKYGSRLNDLKTVNFTWPSAQNDRYLGISYQDSPIVKAALTQFSGKGLYLVAVTGPKSFDPDCRAGGPISLPDFLPYEEYIRRSINHEFQNSGIYDDKPGANLLTGAITELGFSTTGESHWKIGLQIKSESGRTALVKVTVPFKTDWAAASACANAEDAVPKAVRYLIEALVKSPEFLAILSEPNPSPVSQ